MAIPAPQYHMAAGALAEAETSAYHVCTGVAPDLMEASKRAVRATIDHISNRYDLDRQGAYAICSVASDLRIHELVDAPNWVVGAFLPESVFEGRN